MTQVLIEDTARNNLASWAGEAIRSGTCAGVVVNPFCTPYIGNTYKRSAQRIIEEVRDAGATEAWFDPMTHALQMPGVGDFRYYERWNLWDGEPGSLLTRGARRDHIQRVFALQDELGVPHLAPTVLVNGASGQDALAAVTLFEDALDLDPGTRLSLAGTRSLWRGGPELDALVGTLAQLRGGGWFLTFVRETDQMPPRLEVAEVAGMCRTSRSLSQLGDVHAAFADLSGLPAVAAGATSLGTGWDPRQRSCFFASYEQRAESGSTGGGWFRRPTIGRLYGVVTRAEVERLFNQNPGLAQAVFTGPLHPDGPKEAFLHHLDVLGWALSNLDSGQFEQNFVWLRDQYREAQRLWSDFAGIAVTDDRSDVWIEPLLAGLESYGSDEGWA